LTINIEQVTRITADGEGRAVANFIDGEAVTLLKSYSDFIGVLDTYEKVARTCLSRI
jgi:hypothetical protein